MSSRPQSQRDPAAAVPEEALPFVEKFANALVNAGMQRMPARVLGATLASREGSLTASELTEVLRISPAAVSGAVRYLAQLRLLHRGRKPGERRDHFFIGNELWYEVVGHADQVYGTLAKTLDEGVQAVGVDTVAGRHLAETRDFFDYLAAELPQLVKRWRDQRLSQAPEAGS
ncbi:MarR family transcriptional regulator [Amycolatopsis rhizosphaerae]|uniref:MarR family transcriptional regulator n=1 Tax=Amycolatopsis rhizosphaerae TaxID=2053003 RepID=A0A558CP96_9PSEU|nr:MarR family transcriptional regulator [Amycolatopsis rhizosphaerae]TVT50588.1 MarR family transcriptional regulator [Amycolatopsis rhizosphaerae]